MVLLNDTMNTMSCGIRSRIFVRPSSSNQHSTIIYKQFYLCAKKHDASFGGTLPARLGRCSSIGRLFLRQHAGSHRMGVAEPRLCSLQQATASRLVLLFQQCGRSPQGVARKQYALAVARRRVAFPLGQEPRGACQGFLQGGFRRLCLGQGAGADELERGWHSEKRHVQVWRTALFQSTCHLPAQCGCGRLERRRDAYASQKLDDL